MKYFVKPQFRFRTIGNRLIPGIFGVRFSGNQTPVDGANILFFQYRHDVGKQAVVSAGHVFAAEQWTVVAFQGINSSLMFFRIIVVVVGNDIRIFDLKFIQVTQV